MMLFRDFVRIARIVAASVVALGGVEATASADGVVVPAFGDSTTAPRGELAVYPTILEKAFTGNSVSAGAELTQADLDRGVVPKPGDTVILRDFSKLTPQDALTAHSQRGKWWLRPYKEASSGAERLMLMTVERDMDKPETCLVPRVKYPLELDGWYEVWIATYRGPYGGGIDVKLSGDDCFVHINPQQVATYSKAPKPRVDAVVELNYKPAADLTGQSLEFQQPYGTYESLHWGFCEASLAYIRLVRLSDAQVASFKTDQANNDRRRIAVDDDDMSRYWMWGGESAEKILRTYEPLRYDDILFYSPNIGHSTEWHIPTPYSDLYTDDMGRLGDKRMRTMYVDLAAKGIDLLKLSTERAHKYGIKLLPSLRMSAIYNLGKQYEALRTKYHLKAKTDWGRERLDFAYPQVRDHYIKLVRYILTKYDVDGFILDFTRWVVCFNAEEPRKTELMNEFSADMRKMVDEVSVEKGKKLLLAITFSENRQTDAFINTFLKVNVKPAERLAYQGVDVGAWVENGYYDIIMPEATKPEKYIEMTRGTTTRCFPRWEAHNTPTCEPLGVNIHDPTVEEDKKDAPLNPENGPRDYEAGWLSLYEKGADGVFLFNMDGSWWNTLRRMGHIDEVRRRVASGEVYGLIEGPVIEFANQK